MNNSDNSDEEKIPKSPFAVYRTEADTLFRGGKYSKAIKCYTQALELQAGHEHCLVARSRCYLLEGQMEKALADADASLGTNNKNPKGIFQKAEVYYFQSEFEKALVLYHRGHKLRPEMEAFRLGIQKAEEAINNSVGDPETIKLRLDCDLSYFFLNTEKKNDKILKKKQTQEKKQKLERKPCNTDSKTVKQLLGELYSDREFLEKLLNEEESLVNKTENSEHIRHLVVKGLNYLDERSDFWQQQKPMYARKKYQYKKLKASSTANKHQKDIIKYVVSSLDEIDNKQTRGEHKKAIKQSEYLIKQIDKWSENDLPDRLDILANLYCLIGNSYLDLEDYVKALEYHERDKYLGKTNNIEESISRSIDNLGRVYAKQKQYTKAIEIWQEKVPMSKSALESTWLHHEMGRCYLELEDYENAIEFGEKSIEFAREAEDDTWQMNASILVAQAAMKFKKYSLAIEHFDRALEYSKIMKNGNAEEAIKKAIEEVNQKIINEESEKQHTESAPDQTERSEESKKDTIQEESEQQSSRKSTERKQSKHETNEDQATDRETSPIKDEIVTKEEKYENETKNEREDISAENPDNSKLTPDTFEEVTTIDNIDLSESHKVDSPKNEPTHLENNNDNNNINNNNNDNNNNDNNIVTQESEKTENAPENDNSDDKINEHESENNLEKE